MGECKDTFNDIKHNRFVINREDIIKDGDNMIWCSPNNEFKFDINRYDNQLWYDDYSAKYIIEINIYNMVGVLVKTIRFDEIMALSICDSIADYIDIVNSKVPSENYMIYINPNNFRFESYIISLDKTTAPIKDMNGDERNIVFALKQYSPYYENMITIFTLYLSSEQLENLLYAIFFVGLIDAELPYPYNENLDDLAARI